MRQFLLGAALLSAGCSATLKQIPLKPAAHHAAADDIDPFAPFSLALAVSQDAVVRVVTPGATCTGTLVDEDLVVTAHHCVVRRGAHGENTKTDLAGSDVSIELGGDYLPWGTIAVKELVAPPCGHGGGAGDIAVLVLDRKLVGLPPMTARLDGAPKIGEVVDPVGFGRCALSGDGIHRSVRAGGAIGELQGTTLTMNASICPGDSGAPVFVRGTHEVVGVVSTSAMDASESTRGLTVIVRVDSHRDVFNQARLIADGMHKNELPPLTCR